MEYIGAKCKELLRPGESKRCISYREDVEYSRGCQKAGAFQQEKRTTDFAGHFAGGEKSKYPGGIYHKTQIDLTYNSNHMEGSRLTHDQTRYIFETNTIGVENEVLNVDDVIETANHFRCIDLIIDHANQL